MPIFHSDSHDRQNADGPTSSRLLFPAIKRHLPSGRRAAYCLLLALVMISGLLLRFQGLTEGIHLHPDEILIRDWMGTMYWHQEVIHGRTMADAKGYTGGYFVLASVTKSAIDHTIGKIARQWAYFTRSTNDYLPRKTQCDESFGRPFIAWLGTLAVFLGALVTLRVTGSGVASLVVALLLAFDPYSIEHAHYLETDIAMLFMLSLSVCLIARFIERRSIIVWALAAVSTGFAIGTKYPMAMLLLPLCASLRPPSFCARKSTGTKTLWVVGMAIATLFIVLWGFTLACPDAKDLPEYMRLLKEGASGVYSETAACVGEAWREPFIREKMNFNNLRHFTASISPACIPLAAIGMALVLAVRRYRPYWPLLLLCPLFYLYYFIFKAPWVRSQEFLPIVLLTALLASLPVAWLWKDRGKARRVTSLLLASLLLWPAMRNGLAMGSQFGWEDTRRLAARDLSISYPPDKAMGFERYSNGSDIGVTTNCIRIVEYAKTTAEEMARIPPPPYFMRNVDQVGRGVCHPATGELYPAIAERERFLHERGILLGSWAVLDSPAPQPTFRAPKMELWRLPEWVSTTSAPSSDLEIPLPRPVLVKDTMGPHDGRETFFRQAPAIGARKAVLIDRFPRRFAIGGPGDLGEGPVYCVLMTHELAATIVVEGLGRREKINLPPYSARVVALKRPWYRPRISRYETLEVRALKSSPYVIYLPCFLQVAFTASDAAAVLLDAGHPDEAASLLGQANAPEALHPFWRVLQGDRRAIPEARVLLDKWKGLADAPEERMPSILVDGIPLDVWQDFARIRLLPLGGASFSANNSMALQDVLPVPGTRQSLLIKAMTSRPASPPPEIDLLATEGKPLTSFQWPEAGRDRMVPLGKGRGFSFLRMYLASTNSVDGFQLEKADYVWNWRDMLRHRIGQLERAITETETPPPSGDLAFNGLFAIQSAKLVGTDLHLVVLPLKDDLPSLAFQWRKKRHGRWKKTDAPIPLPPCERLNQISLVLPLPEKLSPDQVRLSCESIHNGLFSSVPCSTSSGELEMVLSIDELTRAVSPVTNPARP